MCVEQWPLTSEKLEQLVQEQLNAQHIELTSPWNSPVFVMKKKSQKMDKSLKKKKGVIKTPPEKII